MPQPLSAPTPPGDPLPAAGAGILLRALCKRARRFDGQPFDLPDTFYRMPAPRRTDVDRYNALLGYPAGAMPLAWFYLPVQRAHLATMLAPCFPFRLVGMVHLENALTAHRPPAAGRALRLATRARVEAPTASGACLVRLVTVGDDEGEPVFTCTSTYLAPGARRPRGAKPVQASPPPGAPLGQWQVGPGEGRAYARVSGDWNPIHLSRWSARLMGLRRPIIHGMHSVGRAAAQLEQPGGRRVSAIAVRFRAPIPLGSAVVLVQGAGPDGFALHCGDVLAAEGSFQLA